MVCAWYHSIKKKKYIKYYFTFIKAYEKWRVESQKQNLFLTFFEKCHIESLSHVNSKQL